MSASGTILVVDDDEDILTSTQLLLKNTFAQVVLCSEVTRIPVLMSRDNFDVILLDMNFGAGESSGRQGLYWLEKILNIDTDAVVVMITAHSDTELAVEAIKRGATDFVGKPWQNHKLLATLSSARQLRRARLEAQQLRGANRVLSQNHMEKAPILGASPAMQTLHSLIERAAPTDANVLILGENGTGKELVAREIHARSTRKDQVFMSVDLGALSQNLFESELFGHRKGAFSGANENRVGRLIAADGGTLFLDEIGNIPLALQAKLLTVLEQRVVTPLGENHAQGFNVRVLAATNLKPEVLQSEAHFRQDLLYRLNTVELMLPPLRARPDDIAAIAEYYLSYYARKYQKPNKTLSASALAALQAYPWPGNVRALRHALERAVILSEAKVLQVQDFSLEPHRAAGLVVSSSSSSPALTPLSDSLNLEALEKAAVTKALQQHQYNISHAAKTLGITRAALYRRMEKYGL